MQSPVHKIPKKSCRSKCVLERLVDPSALSCSKIRGNDRLRGLSHTVGTTLREGTDIDHHPVDRKRVCSKVNHNLTVEQDRQNSHRHIDEKGGKSRYRNLL